MSIRLARCSRYWASPAGYSNKTKHRKIRVVADEIHANELQALPRGKDSDDIFHQPRFYELPYDTRASILGAVRDLGYSGTAADVAQKSSLSIDETDKCLQSLAIDGGGRLQVTEKGDIIYSFPENVNLRLQQQNLLFSSEVYLRSMSTAALQMARIAFGTVLVGSVAFTTIALTAIAVAIATRSDGDSNGSISFSFRDEDSRDTSQGSSGSFWLWWDPWPDMTTKSKSPQQKDTRGGGFFQDAFALVFGGPDPNTDFERERWRVVGEKIAAYGGVVAAEDVRPLLDAPSGSAAHEEEYMLPVLLRFNGTADIAEVPGYGPALLYTFPELQRTAAASPASPLQESEPSAAKPRGLQGAVSGILPWLKRFTSNSSISNSEVKSTFLTYEGKEAYAKKHKLEVVKVHPSNTAPLTLLVAANCTLVSLLQSAVHSPGVMQALQQSSGPAFTRLVAAAVPVLTVYASLYVLGPALRWALQVLPNARIASENAARATAAQVLGNPSAELQSKLKLARARAQRIDVRRAEKVYDTAREETQGNSGSSRSEKGDAQYEMDDWDSRLGSRTKS